MSDGVQRYGLYVGEMSLDAVQISMQRDPSGGFVRYQDMLLEIRIATEELREQLAEFLGEKEKVIAPAPDSGPGHRQVIGYGYYEGGRPYFETDEVRAGRKSTCRITPLYNESDKADYLAGRNSLCGNTSTKE